MSLEYAIEYPCEMRRQYDEPTLRALGRTGSLVSRIVAESIEGARPPSEESFRFTTRLAADLERSEQVAAFCQQHCPAHLGSVPAEPIGCLGRISYPVEARFERFLADRLQLICDTVAPGAWPQLLHVLLDAESPFDGEGAKELRRVTTAEGLRFFELRLPIKLARRAGRLTTDHLFDLLAGFTASDGGAAGYARELPALALPDYADFLDAVLVADLGADERERLDTQGTSYRQYARFARAVRLAEGLGVRVLMD